MKFKVLSLKDLLATRGNSFFDFVININQSPAMTHLID